ncbi:hypothetical protein [Shimazuella alba]|uniref:Uncharacterized protein n=1 Tax=Shimazuella alba TaxID=2690964 RepID=A0A6I4VM45_9BACL|nr:hypothetical protein [Shimazuella alba]MXQ52699.1 hypothetical protein [Shimazuella alba]
MKNQEILCASQLLDSLEQGMEQQQLDQYLGVVLAMDVDVQTKKQLISAFFSAWQQQKQSVVQEIQQLRSEIRQHEELDKARDNQVLKQVSFIRRVTIYSKRRLTILHDKGMPLLENIHQLLIESGKFSIKFFLSNLGIFLVQELIKASVGGDKFFGAISNGVKSGIKRIEPLYSLYVDILPHCPKFLIDNKEAVTTALVITAVLALIHTVSVSQPIRRSLEFIRSLFASKK